MEEPKSNYIKNLDIYDLFFAGYGFIIGAGIFTLMPFIIKYSKGNSWLAFVMGGIICVLVGLSYSKLNLKFPTNDAEYVWIYKIFNKDEKTPPSIPVKLLSSIVIWVVMAIGLFNAATVLVGQTEFINSYFPMNKKLLSLGLISFTTLLNCLGNKYSTAFNKGIMGTVTAGFFLLFGIAGFKGKRFNEISFIPTTSSLLQNANNTNIFKGLVQSSFISIFAFNGFQSLVQLSEEAKDKKDIPKGILTAIGFTTFIYAAVAISIIVLIGVQKAKTSLYPISDAYGVLFGSKGRDIVTIISIIVLLNTLMLITLSRSRILQKLAIRKQAPKFFQKLTSLEEIFRKKEKFTDNIKNKNKNDNSSDKVTLPINSILAVSIITYLLTFIKKGAIEGLANITNIFIFFVFILVHVLVIVDYHKNKGKDEDNHKYSFLKGFPWYAYIGGLISIGYFYKSFSY